MKMFRLRDLSFIPLIAITLGGIIAVTLLAFVAANANDDEEAEKNDNSHGLGNHVAWVSLQDGISIAKEQDKPLMLIIHKSWCGACKALKPKIKESKELGELSQNFVMVNTQDEDEPPEEIYKPDGGYIPRILFFNPKGELLKDVINEDGNPQYKYYYYDIETVMSSMRKVIEMFQGPQDTVDQNTNFESKLNDSFESKDKTEL